MHHKERLNEMDNILNRTRFILFEEYLLFLDGEKMSIKELNYIPKENYILKNVEVRANLKKKSSPYDPLLEGKGLFTELAKLPTVWEENFNLQSVLSFLNRFSLPVGGNPFSRFERVLMVNMLFRDFFHELATYKSIFNIWIALKENNIQEIKKISKEHDDFFSLHFRDTPAPITDKDKALYIFANQFNKQSKGNETFTYSNGSPIRIKTFSNLFEVAYFQLSNFINDSGEFRVCRNCEQPFPLMHESSLFCPPLPLNTVSNCMNAYKQRKNRDKKKALLLHAKGHDLKDITQSINKNRYGFSKRTTEEIKEWINR